MELVPDHSLRNVLDYPKEHLTVNENGISIPVTYMKSWNDGFGARGWKLDVTIGDPEIIASTRVTGERINTSVFVHDILEHLLSGFGVSGHRSEAMALSQLSKRTKSDPEPDYEQMVREDILHGRVNGETLISFLPDELKRLLPTPIEMNDHEIMDYLKRRVNEGELLMLLVRHFLRVGNGGDQHAINSWSALGLSPSKQSATGIALQHLLEDMDVATERLNIDMLRGNVLINNKEVWFSLSDTKEPESIDGLCRYIHSSAR